MIFPDVNYICLIYSRAACNACFSRYIALFLQLSASRYFTKNTPNHFQRLRQILPKILIPSPQTIHPAPKHPLMPRTVQIPAVPQIHPHMPPPEQQIPGLCPFLHQTHLLPFSPDRFHRIPFPDIRIPPNQNPIHQIHHKHHTRTVNPIRRLPAPPVLASKIPLRTLHNLPPKLLFRPPLRNPLLHKKPLFRFSPQKPIRIQSFS